MLALAIPLWASDAAAQSRPLRELSTDRPDRTESPVTVDRGHFQLELDFVNATDSRSARAYGLGAINAKIGLRDNLDLQLVTQVHERAKTGPLITGSTLPDFTARLKHNLWGNDGGRTALALMPFVTVPRESGGIVEGGLIVPLAVDLAPKWSLGTMLELDALAAESGSGHQINVVNTVTVGRDLADQLGMYGELAAELRNAAVKTVAATANGGFTFRLGENVQFDAGANFGLNDYADRVRVFIGMSRRF
jgi:hypothetical protein